MTRCQALGYLRKIRGVSDLPPFLDELIARGRVAFLLGAELLSRSLPLLL
jgi:hypothetical protein